MFSDCLTFPDTSPTPVNNPPATKKVKSKKRWSLKFTFVFSVELVHYS